MDERLGELDPLLHPGRVATDRPVALLVQADVAEDLGCALARGGLRQSGHARHVGDEIGRRRVGREAVVLGHVADELADRRALAAHVEVHHGRLAGGRRQQPEEDLDERALAGAVGSDQADDPRFELEGEAVERGHAARILLRQVPKGDEAHAPLRVPGRGRRRSVQRNLMLSTTRSASVRIASRVESSRGSMASTIGPPSLSMTTMRVVPIGLEVVRLRARPEEGDPVGPGRGEVDDGRPPLVDPDVVRAPGGHPIGHDERLDQGATGTWRIGRIAVRIHAQQPAGEGQAALRPSERDEVGLPERGRPAVAELEPDRRLEARRLVGPLLQAAREAEDRIAQVARPAGRRLDRGLGDRRRRGCGGRRDDRRRGRPGGRARCPGRFWRGRGECDDARIDAAGKRRDEQAAGDHRRDDDQHEQRSGDGRRRSANRGRTDRPGRARSRRRSHRRRGRQRRGDSRGPAGPCPSRPGHPQRRHPPRSQQRRRPTSHSGSRRSGSTGRAARRSARAQMPSQRRWRTGAPGPDRAPGRRARRGRPGSRGGSRAATARRHRSGPPPGPPSSRRSMPAARSVPRTAPGRGCRRRRRRSSSRPSPAPG